MRLAGLVALSLVLAAGSLQAEDVFRVGMDTRSPPWSFVPGLDYGSESPEKAPQISEAQLRRVTGIDVDSALALGQRMGVTVRIVPVAWFDLENALVSKRIDAILNAWTPGRLTPATIVASEPYYEWGLIVATRTDNAKVKSYADLSQATVGHFKSQVVERTLRSIGAAHLKVYDVQEALFDDLAANKVDAIVYDSPYVRWRVSRDKTFRTVGEPLNRLGYHVGLRREDTALLARVQAAVKDLVSSGERERIRKRWETPQ
jgi:polar amino acid transport system substrate-binding protein